MIVGQPWDEVNVPNPVIKEYHDSLVLLNSFNRIETLF